MLCVTYKYKYLQQKNKNIMGIITPKFGFAVLLARRGEEENKADPRGTPMMSVLHGFFKINLNYMWETLRFGKVNGRFGGVYYIMLYFSMFLKCSINLKIRKYKGHRKLS